MYQGKKFLALLPARGGSKGCPEKNIRILIDKPLLAWTIDAVFRSKYIDNLIVSTDSEKIASTARKLGAAVPFIRPNELASDKASMTGVINHVLKWVVAHEESYDYLILVQPTSPLRTAEHLDAVIELALNKHAEAVVSVTKAEHTPLFCNVLPDDGSLYNFIPSEYRNKNRQDLPQYYRINGSIFMVSLNYWRKHEDWFGEKSYAYVMDRRSSVDIDAPDDFLLAECLLRQTS